MGKMNTSQRIAKTLSRAGVSSRREAEKLVLSGSVSVNGVIVTNPATMVESNDQILVDGKSINPPENSRLWCYHKPVGLVSTNFDEKGRPTIHDKLPSNLPRLMLIGRLDIASEGLILLTNDGAVKRHFELPSSGFERKYRVRAHGIHNELSINALRTGICVDGEEFKPMGITLDRIKGKNVWYYVVLTEGRNREIRRAFKYINMNVNRLIRTSFGPFELSLLRKGELKEVSVQVIRQSLRLNAVNANKRF